MTRQAETPAVGGATAGVSTVLSGGLPGGASGTGNGNLAPFSLSIPSIGAYRTEDHRYYWNGKGPVPSVTTILKVLDKPAVVQWAKRTVAEIAVDKWEEVGARMQPRPAKVHPAYVDDDGNQVPEQIEPAVTAEQARDETIRWLASMPDYKADEAAKIGSGVHLLADMQARASESDGEGFQIPDEYLPYLKGFQGFLGLLSGSDHPGVILSSEKMIWNEQGYAGTYDLLVRFSCVCHLGLWLLDIKTSKGVYADYALQLAAYGFSDSIILEGNPEPYPMPQVDRYGVLHLRPEYEDTGWRLVEYVGLGEKEYLAFLGALEVFSWKKEGRFSRKELTDSTYKP